MKAQYEFLQLYMSLNEKVRLSIGHQFVDFIKECTFLGSDCLNVRLRIMYFLASSGAQVVATFVCPSVPLAASC